MIQKKVCMVGVYGTGKTSLVQRFVHSLFSAKYHSTVGVKIDRKTVDVGGTTVNMLLWDVEGRTAEQDIPASYLRGAHAVFFVADGTRRDTFEQLFDLREHARSAAGDVPSIVALNKADLKEQWALTAADSAKLITAGFHVLTTSAKTGDGVEAAFLQIATATLNAASAANTQPVQPPVRHGN
jgi:small GTP-binding protein